MSDSPKPEQHSESIRPRRHHSDSMPVLASKFLPARIGSGNLPAIVRTNLPAPRRKSNVTKTN